MFSNRKYNYLVRALDTEKRSCWTLDKPRDSLSNCCNLRCCVTNIDINMYYIPSLLHNLTNWHKTVQQGNDSDLYSMAESLQHHTVDV